MRWLALMLEWQSSGPKADIVVFAVYHDGGRRPCSIDRRRCARALIAVTNLFASRDARGSNQVVLAHELLHTLGATDKYAPESNQPQFPDGFADPSLSPLLPQKKAELMAGRIPLDATTCGDAGELAQGRGRPPHRGARSAGCTSEARCAKPDARVVSCAERRLAGGSTRWAIDSAKSIRARATTARPGSPTAHASPKFDARVEAAGDIDETNSVIGLLLAEPGLIGAVATPLRRIQHELFEVGAELAPARLSQDRRRACAPARGRARRVERRAAAAGGIRPAGRQSCGGRLSRGPHRMSARRAACLRRGSVAPSQRGAAALFESALGFAVRHGALARARGRRSRGPLAPRDLRS